jgi:hypothetical protein
MGVLVHRLVEEMGVVMNEWKDTDSAMNCTIEHPDWF